MSSVFRNLFLRLRLSLYLCAAIAALFINSVATVLAAPPAGYYEVWGDEFSGSALDTTKWDYWLLGARRDAVNVTNAVAVSGGNLVITTYTTNSTHYTAMVATDGTFRSRYGYWEASIKWGDTNGMWSAFWMQSPTMGAYLNDPFVSGSEMDIVEHRGTDGGSNGNIINQVQNNIHWNGYGSSAASAGSGNIGGGLGNGFHTYGFLWTPGTASSSVYTLYVDGSNLRSWSYANNAVPISQSSEWTILSSEVDDTSTTWAGTIPSGGYGNLATSTTKLTVDYVRYYAPTNTIFWSGASSAYWTNSANWVSNMVPTTKSALTFSFLSANLNPQLAQNYSVDGLVFLNMNNSCTIGGTNTLTLGAGGVDMIAANHSVTLSCPINIGAAQTWLVGPNNPGNTLTDNGGISGTATLSKGSYGTLVLTGTNTFSGSLNVDTSSTSANDGALQIASSTAVASVASPISILNNNLGSSTLQLNGTATNLTIPQNISLAGRNTNVIALQNLAGSNTLSGNLILQVGGVNYWLDSDSGTLNFAGAVPASTPGGTRTLTFMGAGNSLISGTLQNGTGGGTVNLMKTNAGTLTINNASTYTGTTMLAQGIIQANASNAFGSSGITADSGANNARIILGNGVTITNSLVANTVNPGVSTGLIMVNDNTSATFSGPISFLTNAASGGHFYGPITTGLLSINGPITSGITNFLVIRAGNVRFSGGGNYFEIQPRSQTTSLGANNGLATNAAVDLAGNGSTTVPTILDLNGFNQTLSGLKNSVTAANVAWVTNSGATTNTLTLALNGGTTNAQSFGGSVIGGIALTLASGTQTFAKTGTSALNGLYSYRGNTTLNGGKLILGSGITLPNTPQIFISGGAVLDASAANLNLGAAQTLKGSGALIGALTVSGTLAPGTNIGALSITGAVTFASGGKYICELASTTDSPGVNNDFLAATGTLTVSATSGSPFIIKPVASALAGWNNQTNYSWTLATGNSVSGFAANKFSVDASAFTNNLGGGSLAVAQSGNSLALKFVPNIVPIQFTNAVFVSGGVFKLAATGVPGNPYSLWSATNLASPINWLPLASTNADTNGLVNFSDALATNSPQKFYRLSSP